jgi:hypothetical protein
MSSRRRGWGHIETDVFDVSGLVQAGGAFGEAFDLISRKNEAMVGGFPRNSFVFMEFEEGSGIAEVATLAFAPVGLDLAKLVERLLELAGEALAVQSQRGEEAVGVHDIEGDGGFFVRGLVARASRSASSNGMRLMRQAVSASSWTS